MNKIYFPHHPCLFKFIRLHFCLLVGLSFICSQSALARSVASTLNKTTSRVTFADEQVTSFSLINAKTNEVIRTIQNGATINLATIQSKNLNIRANTAPAAVGSVKITLSGTQSYSQLENIAPYNLFGDDVIWTPAAGTYALEATPYSGSKGTGSAGTTASVSFRIVNNPPSSLVTAVTTTTGRSYTITQLKSGVILYTDRAYQVTAVPVFLENATFIRTANNDKTNTSASVATLTLAKAAKLYVAYDPRATALPAWLSGWQKLTDRLPINDPKGDYLALYTKTFPAGTVNLGGNLASPAAGALNNYVVLAEAAAPNSNGYLVLENPDKFPANDELIFSRLRRPWRRTQPKVTPYNKDQDKTKLKLINKGSGNLTISKLTLSSPDDWKIDSISGVPYNAQTSLPLTLKSGESAELYIRFVAVNTGRLVILHQDKLTITSNDNTNPNKEVTLRGLWQYRGEGVNEPNSQQIINAFGFKSKTGYKQNDGDIDGRNLVPNSDEVAVDYFVRADVNKPVSVVQMGAYHGCCSQVENIEWYDKQTNSKKTVFFHDALYGQALLPRRHNSKTVAAGNFNPANSFGFLVGSSNTDRTKNFENRFGMRVWKAVDTNGNIIPNAYIMGTDYLGTDFTNYDYQDNVYFISNVRPETGSANYSELAAAPSAVNFGSVMAGNSSSLAVKLTNLGKNFGNGADDPDVEITGIDIEGPDNSDFSVTYFAGNKLAPQGSATATVGFSPKSRGLKNAALLIRYNTASAPLRIPLYGMASNENTQLVLAKRIKGGSDADITINGNVWESDKNYRKGSVRLDQQVIPGPIAGTDDDVLYQTYLSATTNLAQTRLEVPLENGVYQVRMHFVENFFDAPAARIFDINLEKQLRLANFEIYREVGYRAALVKDFEVTVSDGLLNMDFNPTANRLALAGVEIYKVTPKGTMASARTATNSEEAAITSGDQQILIYPNPAKGEKVKIELSNFANQEQVTVNMLNVVGQLLQSRTVVTNVQGKASIELPADQLKNGLYIINANAVSGQAQTKLMIEK